MRRGGIWRIRNFSESGPEDGGAENTVNININVKRNFKVNGKVYNSIEEMPEDIKGIFRKAMSSHAGTDAGRAIDPASMPTKIVFNGTEYDGIDAMPNQIRQLYDQVLEATETAAAPSLAIGNGMPLRPEASGSFQGIDRNPTKTESSFSPKALIVSVVLFALILMFYYLIRSR